MLESGRSGRGSSYLYSARRTLRSPSAHGAKPGALQGAQASATSCSSLSGAHAAAVGLGSHAEADAEDSDPARFGCEPPKLSRFSSAP